MDLVSTWIRDRLGRPGTVVYLNGLNIITRVFTRGRKEAKEKELGKWQHEDLIYFLALNMESRNIDGF